MKLMILQLIQAMIRCIIICLCIFIVVRYKCIIKYMKYVWTNVLLLLNGEWHCVGNNGRLLSLKWRRTYGIGGRLIILSACAILLQIILYQFTLLFNISYFSEEYFVSCNMIDRISKISVFNYLAFLFPLYYFCYREKRAISESFMTLNDIKIRYMFSNMNVIFGLIYVSYIDKHNFIYTLVIKGMTVIWFLSFFYNMFSNLKATHLIEEIYGDVLFCSKIIKSENKTSNDIYIVCDELVWKIEIFYQIILYALEHHLNNIRDSASAYIREINNQLIYYLLCVANPGSNSEDIENKYKSVIGTFLFYHKSLCIYLFANKQTNMYKENIDVLICMYEYMKGEKSSKTFDYIRIEYFKTLWSLCEYLSSCDRDAFYYIIKKIINIDYHERYYLDVIVVYRALIIINVNNNNINNLTELCYVLLLFEDNIKKKKTINDHQHYTGINLYILLCAMMKSLELGQLPMTGYLAKFIVSNYNEQLKCVQRKLFENNFSDKIIKARYLTSQIGVYFSINKRIFGYLFKKMTILIVAQQLMMKKNNLISIERECNENTNIDWGYHLSKILNNKNEYKMLALLDKNNISRLKQYFKEIVR